MTGQPVISAAPRRVGLATAIGLVMLFGLALRLWQIDAVSLWMDEAYSVWFASRSWSYLWTEVPRFETHPSFYYSVLKLWRGAFGDSEFTLRLLSALVGTATIPVVAMTAYFCGSGATRYPAAILAALLFACSTTQLTAAQDARPYVFLTLGLALGLLSTVRVMTDRGRAARPMRQLLRHDRGMALAFVGIGVAIALMGWSHNIGPVFGGLLGLCLLLWWLVDGMSRHLLVNLLLSAAVATLLFAPNIPILLMQMEVMGDNGFWLETPYLRQLIETVIMMPLGLSPYDTRETALSAVAVCFGLAGLVALMLRRRSAGLPLALPLTLLALAVIPAALTFVLSRIGQPIFMFRTLQPSQVPVIIGMAFAPFLLHRLRVVAIAGLLLLALASSWSFHTGSRHTNENWRDLALAIGAHADGETAKVVVMPTEAELPLLYYRRQLDLPMELITVPGAYPAIAPGYAYPAGGGGAPGVTAQMLPALQDGVADAHWVWFISRRADLYDPAGLVAGYLGREFPCLLLRQAPDRELLSRRADDGSCPQL